MKHSMLLFLLITITTLSNAMPPAAAGKPPSNETIYRMSQGLCWNCVGDAIQFLYGHNLVRVRKMQLPLRWDSELARYAAWWAGQRRRDCAVKHSFPDGGFKLGENIYWGSGQAWTAMDAVGAWADEERYYDYDTNSCAAGEMCGHYTQIVWSSTRKIGCARVVCDGGDVFITCNYSPPGNYVGERPY